MSPAGADDNPAGYGRVGDMGQRSRVGPSNITKGGCLAGRYPWAAVRRAPLVIAAMVPDAAYPSGDDRLVPTGLTP